jgi:hypothetical protein
MPKRVLKSIRRNRKYFFSEILRNNFKNALNKEIVLLKKRTNLELAQKNL